MVVSYTSLFRVCLVVHHFSMGSPYDISLVIPKKKKKGGGGGAESVRFPFSS